MKKSLAFTVLALSVLGLYIYPLIAQIYFAINIFKGFIQYKEGRKISYHTPFQFEAKVTLEWMDRQDWEYSTVCTISPADLKKKTMTYLVIHGDTAHVGDELNPHAYPPHFILYFHPRSKIVIEVNKKSKAPRFSKSSINAIRSKFWSLREETRPFTDLTIRFENLSRSIDRREAVRAALIQANPNSTEEELMEIAEKTSKEMKEKRLLEYQEKAHSTTTAEYQHKVKSIELNFNMNGVKLPSKNHIFNHQEVVRRLKLSGAFETTIHRQIKGLKPLWEKFSAENDAPFYEQFSQWMGQYEFERQRLKLNPIALTRPELSDPYVDSFDLLTKAPKSLFNCYYIRQFLLESILDRDDVQQALARQKFQGRVEVAREFIQTLKNEFKDEIEGLRVNGVDPNSQTQNQALEYLFENSAEDHTFPMGIDEKLKADDMLRYLAWNRYKTYKKKTDYIMGHVIPAYEMLEE